MIYIDFIGYIGVILYIISLSTQNIKTYRILSIIATGLYGINILFYNGYNGAFVNILSVITQLYAYYSNKNRILIAQVSPLFALLAFIILDEGIYSLFPSLGLIFSLVSITRENILLSKYWILLSSLSWLIYGIISGSIPAILFDGLGLLFLISSIYILRKK